MQFIFSNSSGSQLVHKIPENFKTGSCQLEWSSFRCCCGGHSRSDFIVGASQPGPREGGGRPGPSAGQGDPLARLQPVRVRSPVQLRRAVAATPGSALGPASCSMALPAKQSVLCPTFLVLRLQMASGKRICWEIGGWGETRVFPSPSLALGLFLEAPCLVHPSFWLWLLALVTPPPPGPFSRWKMSPWDASALP